MKKIILFILIFILALSSTSLVYHKEQINNLNEEYIKLNNFSEQDLLIFIKDENEESLVEKSEKNINILKNKKIKNKNKLKSLEEKLKELTEKNNELEEKIQDLEKEKAFILDQKITYNQFPKYPSGCESVSLYILLKYNNVDVTVEDIVNNVKKSELPYYANGKIYGGNPEETFVGDPKTNYSYGGYNKPFKEVANMYKSGIISEIGMPFEDMINIVKTGRAVMVWTTIGLVEPYISQTWIDKDSGETIEWIANEHAVVVIGYNESNIIVSDPYTGTIRYYKKTLFKKRYVFLGSRVLYY